jgi:HEAT repeat protein
MSDESIDDLFAASLKGDREDDAAWDAVKKLRFLGSKEVLDKAIALTHSDIAEHRARGADVLGQLGVGKGVSSTSFIPQRLDALLAMLPHETDPVVLDAVIIAIGHLGEPEGVRAVVPFATHPDENVRYAVAWVLPRGLGDEPQIVDTLIRLMQDPDSDVRDWATFGLGSQSRADSPVIRDALAERLQDSDDDTRAEATVGLAQRKDLRALPIVLEELERDEYGVLYEEAASHLLNLEEVKPEGWESWRYVEELRTRFNIQNETPGKYIT